MTILFNFLKLGGNFTDYPFYFVFKNCLQRQRIRGSRRNLAPVTRTKKVLWAAPRRVLYILSTTNVKRSSISVYSHHFLFYSLCTCTHSYIFICSRQFILRCLRILLFLYSIDSPMFSVDIVFFIYLGRFDDCIVLSRLI